ncbi:DUF3089 domain-containing protein [Paraconexibacter sp.]|uniref:DUF3089 domain-containing protein n=1 Tax=Paraconexibacter sp. TaxID=2949640 RepID=UPI0035643737
MRRMVPVLLSTITVGLATAASASADAVWLCRPGLANDPCQIPQDTTIRELDGSERVETPKASDTPAIDCFYVYPTVSNQLTANADFSRDPEIESIAKFQAARFNQQCRVYAPIYRQATLASIGTGYASASGADRQLAYKDVVDAWREYLAKDNDGRGVVLIGHSQGTGMLRQLLRREIEPDPAQLRRLVSALLIGGNVTVAEGRDVGGDFRSTPLCTRRAQVACVVAYSTFAQDPTTDARFGRSRTPAATDQSTLPGGPGYAVACTDPRPLAGESGPLRILLPTEPYAPGPIAAGIIITNGGPAPTAPTTWVVPADRYTGACRTINGANVLRIEPVGASRRPNFFPEPNWGTHLVDVNLAYESLVALVAQQARRWTAPELRLTRRCVGRGRLRVRVSGPETEFIREVRFKFARRLVARDRSAAYERTLSGRTVASTRARTLRAVIRLDAGPRRVILQRTLPGCGTR